MTGRRLPHVGLVWTQFAAYHIDRCEAVGLHLQDRAQVVAVEMATGSRTYAWEPSGALEHARKTTLFPGRSYDDVPVRQRFVALLRALRGCDVVFFGIGYNELYIIAIAWILRLMGRRVVMMTDSKFEDMPRAVWFEAMKSLVLRVFQGAIVAGPQQRDYVRFLGFGGKQVMLGYDCVGNDRLRVDAASGDSAMPGWGERPFICVARMVPKKNLPLLLDAYAAYRAAAGAGARRLVLVGNGEQEAALRQQIADLGIVGEVDLPGFLDARQVSRLMARSLALVLLSTEEQWGLVVNEAVALGLPAIISDKVGARDVLVRNLINGYVVDPGCVEAVVQAMLRLSRDEVEWSGMSERSRQLAEAGDVGPFARSVEAFVLTA